jgi:hypothetical protein
MPKAKIRWWRPDWQTAIASVSRWWIVALVGLTVLTLLAGAAATVGLMTPFGGRLISFALFSGGRDDHGGPVHLSKSAFFAVACSPEVCSLQPVSR